LQHGESEKVEALEAMATCAREAGVFSQVDIGVSQNRLECQPRDTSASASYRVQVENDRWSVSLVTSDRWLSESIEAELMHCGDSLEELIEEELVDLGIDPDEVSVQHYRNDDMLYVFLSLLPPSASSQEASTWLLAYEAAFRPLGDMTAEAVD
jgi:hypothetical protein